MGTAAAKEFVVAQAKAIGTLELGVITTPYRLVTNPIPNFYRAVKERSEGKGRAWDVIFSGSLVAGDVAGSYTLGRGAISSINRTRAAMSVETPYGTAHQQLSLRALRLRWQVARGKPVFRGGAFGKSAAAEGQFWAPESPLAPGYNQRYGVASFKEPDFVIQGTLKPSSRIVTRAAPAVGSNPGGAMEIVTRAGEVFAKIFHMP
jgi:hypothetical protein